MNEEIRKLRNEALPNYDEIKRVRLPGGSLVIGIPARAPSYAGAIVQKCRWVH